MRRLTLLPRVTLVTTFLAILGLAGGLPAEESRELTQTSFTVGAEKNPDTIGGDFTVPYRLVRRWRTLASAPAEAIEERVLQTGAVLGRLLFSDVEITGSTIHLWIPVNRPFLDPDSWPFYSDLADMMVVRCRCIEGTAVVEHDSTAPDGQKHPIQYFRFNVETGRSRIDLR